MLKWPFCHCYKALVWFQISFFSLTAGIVEISTCCRQQPSPQLHFHVLLKVCLIFFIETNSFFCCQSEMMALDSWKTQSDKINAEWLLLEEVSWKWCCSAWLIWSGFFSQTNVTPVVCLWWSCCWYCGRASKSQAETGEWDSSFGEPVHVLWSLTPWCGTRLRKSPIVYHSNNMK